MTIDDMAGAVREICGRPPAGRTMRVIKKRGEGVVYVQFTSRTGRDSVVACFVAPNPPPQGWAAIRAWLRDARQELDIAKQMCAEIDGEPREAAQ